MIEYYGPGSKKDELIEPISWLVLSLTKRERSDVGWVARIGKTGEALMTEGCVVLARKENCQKELLGMIVAAPSQMNDICFLMAATAREYRGMGIYRKIKTRLVQECKLCDVCDIRCVLTETHHSYVEQVSRDLGFTDYGEFLRLRR